MKDNLMKYLQQYRDKSFLEAPFSEVDALVLSQLSYLKMDGIVPGFSGKASVGWKELQKYPDYAHLFSDPVFGSMYRKIADCISNSTRYGTIRMNYFVEYLDQEREIQFAAVTFFLGESSIFVSFRGTDESLIGWKEDFNMSYMETVPAQKLAVAYLKGVGRYTASTQQVRLILGGHSKGGNLAVYAASNVPPFLQRKIRRVYSFDGPGFQKGFYEQSGFERIESRYCKIVPEQSLIGMMFTNYRHYRVVCSYKKGMIQHDLMHWKIRNGRFVYLRELNSASYLKTVILNRWVNSLTAEQIRLFVETLYDLFQTGEVKNVYELMKTPVRRLRGMVHRFHGLDRERRESFVRTIRKLFEIARHAVKNQ